jgi:hypothetical protein
VQVSGWLRNGQPEKANDRPEGRSFWLGCKESNPE